jgi:hypothetical protein
MILAFKTWIGVDGHLLMDRFCDEDKKCISTTIMNIFRTQQIAQNTVTLVELKSVIYCHYGIISNNLNTSSLP